MELMTRQPVVIDGCFVPFEVYDNVKATADQTGRVQFIGAIYHQPDDLKPKLDEPAWEWNSIMRRDTMRRMHAASGQHMSYIVDKTRHQLLSNDEVFMILWISPSSI